MKTPILITLAVLLAVAAPLYSQQANTTLVGTLLIQWGDPPAGSGSGGRMLYTLVLADGSRVPLQLRNLDAEAAFYFGQRVTVSGRAVTNQFDATQTFDPLALIVDSLSPGSQPSGQAAVFGTKKVMYLLLKFSDDAAGPHPATFYTDLNNPDTPPAGEVFPATVNGFFKKTSWNQFSWVGDVGGAGGLGAPGGWLTLPHPKSYYAPCTNTSCANVQAIGDDGTALGRAQGISFTGYDNINFVLSNDLDCCAWGGGYYSTVDHKSFGATWEPPWGQDAGIYSHEMGHSIGLPHSGWVYYAYDSPWDIMSSSVSATNVACGSYFSRNANSTRTLYCSEPGDGYNGSYKDYLGWIPALNKVTMNTGSTLTTTLEADSLGLSSLAKIVKICITGVSCTGSTAHYFTIEARVSGLGTTSQYDNGIPAQGIVIHEFQGDRPAVSGACYFNNQSGWAWPIDSTPGDYDSVNCNPGGRTVPNYGLYNAHWSAGQTYTNNVYGFTVQVVSRSGSQFVVTIDTPFRRRRGQIVSY